MQALEEESDYSQDRHQKVQAKNRRIITEPDLVEQDTP